MTAKSIHATTQGRSDESGSSDALLRVLIENVSDIISRHAVDGRCLYVSPSVRAVLGRGPDELVGVDAGAFMHPDDVEALSKLTTDIGAADGTTVEYRLAHADGTWRTFETTLRVLTDDSGTPSEVVAVARDVTERKRAEAEVTQAREKILRIYEQMSEPFFVVDRAFRLIYANPLTARMRGNLDELLGKELFELFPDLQGTKFESEYRRALAEDVAVHFEELYPADGRWYEVHAYPSEEGLSVHFRDITERKDILEKLRMSEQRYAEAYEVERAASEHLRALDNMKQAFLTSVSHDLRTPLTAVIGYAETLASYEARLSPATRSQILSRLVVNARRLHAQVSDLLDLDRLVATSFKPTRTLVDVGTVVRNVVMTSDVQDSHPVEIRTDEVTVPVDLALVERVVRNLLSNVVLHTQSGTPVWVTVEAVDGGALLEVADAGPGIDPALADAIFEPFTQGPTMTPSSPRVGIGLSLVARFAELHGGRAWVDQRLDGGAAFKVFFPGAEPTSFPSRGARTGRISMRGQSGPAVRNPVSARERDPGSRPLSGTRPAGS